jgi:hypothetical protein
MLDYKMEDYKIYNETTKEYDYLYFHDLDEVVENISRDGYVCFYRTIEFKKDENGNSTDLLNETHLLFPYRIKDYYLPSSTTNTIFCKIITKDGRELETSISFTFSSFGTSGTDYTLVLSPATETVAINNEAIENQKGLLLNVKLFDYNNEEIPIYTSSSDFTPGKANSPDASFIGPSFCNKEIIAETLSEGTDEAGNITQENIVKSCLITKISDTINCYNAILKFTTNFTIPAKEPEEGEEGTAAEIEN